MSFILDCESGQKVLECLSDAFYCSIEKVCESLLSLDIDEIYEKQWKTIDIPSERYLYNYVVEQLGDHKKLEAVYWFHGTRTLDENQFIDGIQSLGLVLTQIWEFLIETAPNEKTAINLKQIQKDGVLDHLYNLKTNNSLHWGPYAILVKEVAFNTKDLGQHDYLGMPEIIEDICNDYNDKFGISLYEHYNKVLVPKLVKFISTERLDQGCLEAALSYAYTHVRGKAPNSGSITCFDARGINIKPQQILNIEKVMS